MPSKSTVSNRKRAFLVEQGFTSYTELENAIIQFEGAAIIFMLALTGMRQSELAGLNLDCYQEENNEFLSIDHTSSAINGTTYKYSHLPEGEPHRWLVPQKMKPVIQKINQLNKIRRDKNQRRLVRDEERRADVGITSEARKAVNSLFLLPGLNAAHGYSLRMDFNTINRRIHYFVQQSGIIPSSKITAHRFRRTFARLVALSPLGCVEVLREQFGHKTSDVTQYYMQAGDSEILNWIAEDQSDFQRSILDMQVDRFHTKHGALGEAITEESYSSRDFKTSKNLKTLQKQIGTGMSIQLNAHSVSVRPTDRGACANNCRLNRIQCISCENCVITPAQLPFWEDQLTKMEACEAEGIVQGIDKVRTLINQLRVEVKRES
ncbi:site-specific integrase [Vibrio splendidus]|uniref:site-specific integrase n=1 Tax=Vibrio splendidus TaxID=29497 RepID=UPI002158C16B|nr:site-specific integrase [Vibrio splendidus]